MRLLATATVLALGPTLFAAEGASPKGIEPGDLDVLA